MKDLYIDAVVRYLHPRERTAASTELQNLFADSDDERMTIHQLGHPFACSLRFTTRPKALVKGEHRLHYRRSLAAVMIISATIILLLLLIPPLFRPVRITASFILSRAVCGLATAALFSTATVTVLFFLLGSLGVNLPMPRWDEEAVAHFLGEDELVITRGQLRSQIIATLLWLGLLAFLMVRPEAVTLGGRTVFTSAIRVGSAGWILLSLASTLLWTAKRKSGAWTRSLFLFDSIIEAVTVLYSVVLLTRWGLYTPAFVAMVGQGRLKIVVTALSVVWIALTILERANDAYSILTGTAPSKESEATRR